MRPRLNPQRRCGRVARASQRRLAALGGPAAKSRGQMRGARRRPRAPGSGQVIRKQLVGARSLARVSVTRRVVLASSRSRAYSSKLQGAFDLVDGGNDAPSRGRENFLINPPAPAPDVRLHRLPQRPRFVPKPCAPNARRCEHPPNPARRPAHFRNDEIEHAWPNNREVIQVRDFQGAQCAAATPESVRPPAPEKYE